ncbi:LegC family aminotransferase [Candidatus Pelagibacter sp.]|nr:LegC family aminotransferase [Candidatus Pelagibacter sp.]
MFDDLINFIKELYPKEDRIPLHRPQFLGNEIKYLTKTINSTYVSSVGRYVDDFEKSVAKYTKSTFAVATVNGTSALHIALLLAGVKKGDEVITQSLTFVATCNAIRYCNAEPVFVDVSKNTLGLSEQSLKFFLEQNCEIRDDGFCWNKNTNKIIKACLPMHTYGFPAELDSINNLCQIYNINLVEDAAESLGSIYKEKHTGTIGKISALSFNGNKIITTGGGGMLLTDDKTLAEKAKHITTTSKIKHRWAFEHDEIGYNYRLPNLNAALGLAQMEILPKILESKRIISKKYFEWGKKNGIEFIKDRKNTKSNFWLNTIKTNSLSERNKILEHTNNNGVMTRPVWAPMHKMKIYEKCEKMDLSNTEWLCDRLINVPSSPIL